MKTFIYITFTLILISTDGFAEYYSSLNLEDIDGSNGFVMNGENEGDSSGFSVSSAGDINGDGIDDLIIGAFSAGLGGRFNAGKSYVVYGSEGDFPKLLSLSALDGENGFVANGVNRFYFSGISVSSAGDVNGDEIDDLIIGAYGAQSKAGKSYVVYGSEDDLPNPIDLSFPYGVDGFMINGENEDDYSGYSVSSAGDVNGDGVVDLIIGAFSASPNNESSAGKSYVVFGSKSGFSGSLNLSNLKDENGFVIEGENENDWSGRSVSSAGDINDDGVDDLIVGAPGAESDGKSYLIFGRNRNSGFPNPLTLSSLTSPIGLVINGENIDDYLGFSVSSAGDVNDDGIDDLIIGAKLADPNGKTNAGKSYVIFGSASGLPNPFELSSINGKNGFVINGENTGDESGHSVSSAGDVNGDGIFDLIIGANLADPNGNTDAGKSYVIFGSASGLPNPFELSSINGKNGFVINGENTADSSGFSVSSAGDVNDDGFDDLIIGAPDAGPADTSPGRSYVIFGKESAIFTNGFEFD